MIFLILTLCCFGGQILPSRAIFYDLRDAEAFFNDFMHTYNKNYSMEHETKLRFKLFKDNLEYYNAVNNEHKAKVAGITKFSDMHPEEFKRMYVAPKPGDSEDLDLCELHEEADRSVNPGAFLDYRYQSMVTSVKDQARKGYCTHFAAIANVESQYARVNHELVRFSEQQLIDCDNDIGSYAFSKMKYLVNTGGSMTERDYPFQAEMGICRFNPSKVVAKVTNCKTYEFSTEIDIQKILFKDGPVAIQISSHTWGSYPGGIWPASMCKPRRRNHAVLLVGYGTENGVDYWIIKNSWGRDWGENGYIRIERNKNACAINGDGQIISSVVVAKNTHAKRTHPTPTDKRHAQILKQDKIDL